jgi:hypothetical protein
MTSSLVLIHSVLASNNLTTWESLSWKKISYMKIWPEKYGSPFFVSYRDNLKSYFSAPSRYGNIEWTMPTRLPTFEEGEYLQQSKKNCASKCLRKAI